MFPPSASSSEIPIPYLIFHVFLSPYKFDIMKLLRALILPLVLLLGAATSTRLISAAAVSPDSGSVCISVGKLMEQGHYSRHRLDDEISAKLLQNYLEALDYGKLFFTQADFDAFSQKYGRGLDDDILLGTPTPAIDIFKVYRQRVEERVAKIKHIIETEKFAFDSDRTVILNRQKAQWPKDEADADQLWHDRVEGELLQEKLSRYDKVKKALDAKAAEGKVSPSPRAAASPAASGSAATVTGTSGSTVRDTPEKIVAHRYDQLLRNLREQTNQDAVDIFLTCLAQTYDPHSEYMSKNETDNFAINMKLSLVGIGAVLQSEDGYAKIMELVTGGPAQKDGRLKVGDRVTGVAQGDDEFVDTIDMKLDKVVRMIRGQKNTKVRLQVISAHADPSARKIIEIVRDEVKLKDAAAKADIIEKTDSHGNARRLGWITLPSFYADMDRSEAKNAKSTTRDVLALLTRLKQENIGGLVIDLRRNGGGSLDEAIRLTNLFVKRGPVVQVKDANGKIQVLRDYDPSVVYDGPLIVLINRLSASASEIFAAALQDYGRAVIVGDHNSFGKGTVQMLLDVGQAGNQVMAFSGGGEGEAGSLKLTIQKFYRIAGGSTQLHGVASDIVLPSLYDHEDIGECALKGPLPYDTVPAADYERQTDRPLFLEQLRTRSAARVTADPEFKYVMEDLERLKQKISENRISLNEQKRRDEIAKDKSRREARIAERAKRHVVEPKVYTVTLDNVDKPQLELAKNDLTKADPNDPTALEERWIGGGKRGSASHRTTPGSKGKKAAASKAPATDKGADRAGAASDVGDDDGDEDLDALDSNKGPRIDPVRQETLNILADLTELSLSQATASVRK